MASPPGSGLRQLLHSAESGLPRTESRQRHILPERSKPLFLSEGRRGYYYGVVKPAPNSTYSLGLANLALPVSVGVAEGWIFAHELEHNMNLNTHPVGSRTRTLVFPTGTDRLESGDMISLRIS